MVNEIMQNELKQLLKEKKIVMVDFSAVWCHPCHALGRKIEVNIVPKYESDPDIAIVKIDIDKNRDFTQGLEVRGVPTLMFFHNGEIFRFEDAKGPTDRIVGNSHLVETQIIEILDHLKSI